MTSARGAANSVRPIAAVLTAALVAFALLLVMGAPMVNAQTEGYEIVIPLDTFLTPEEGSITELASVDVDDEFLGQTCAVSAVSFNQGSVHPDNDLIVASGGSEVRLEDVEAVPGGTVQGDGILVLGPTIVVLLEAGPDERFSAGIDVVIDCTPIDTTTTTTAPTTTTTEPPTTVPEPTTTTTEVSATTITAPPTTTTTTEAPTTTPAPTTTTSTIPDEVLPTSITAAPSTTEPPETLPFTGADPGTPAMLALALIGLGSLALLVTRGVRDES